MDSKNGYGIRKAKSASISGSFVKNEMEKQVLNSKNVKWPERPEIFPDLMTPVEAAMFLRLDQTGHNPKSDWCQLHGKLVSFVDCEDCDDDTGGPGCEYWSDAE